MTSSLFIKVQGDATAKALADLGDEIADDVGLFVMETAANIEAGVKLRIQQGAKTGRIYKRGNVMHQASAPGQAPASDTGVLIGSIYHEKNTPMTATVGSRISYSASLEFGTTKMAPRPAWTPEVEESRITFKDGIEAIIKEASR